MPDATTVSHNYARNGEAPMLNYIPDGYTEWGYIAESPGIHGELRFTYRPAILDERANLADLMPRTGDMMPKSWAKYHKEAVKLLAKNIKSWSVVDADGKEVAVSIGGIARLKPTLLEKIEDIVLGYRPSDPDPTTAGQLQAASDPLDEYEAEVAAAAGRPAQPPKGIDRDEADEKN